MGQKTATSKEKHKDTLFSLFQHWDHVLSFQRWELHDVSSNPMCYSWSSNVKSGHATAEPHKHSTDGVLSGDSGTHLAHSK